MMNSEDGKQAKDSSSDRWELRLYVAGQTTKSLTAFANLKRICAEYLSDLSYEIHVVDLLDNPQLAETDQIVAIPTLVRLTPLPVRKIIGDLSHTEKVLLGLQVSAYQENKDLNDGYK